MVGFHIKTLSYQYKPFIIKIRPHDSLIFNYGNPHTWLEKPSLFRDVSNDLLSKPLYTDFSRSRRPLIDVCQDAHHYDTIDNGCTRHEPSSNRPPGKEMFMTRHIDGLV